MTLHSHMDYKLIQQIIEPYRFSIRETQEPLHLHKYGLPLRKFTAKRDLVDFLNLKLREQELKCKN